MENQQMSVSDPLEALKKKFDINTLKEYQIDFFTEFSQGSSDFFYCTAHWPW